MCGTWSLKDLTGKGESMESDARDRELKWLNARAELSNRAVSRILGVHHEAVGRARRTGHLGDALRGKIREYMEEHPGGGEDGSRQEGEQQSGESDAGDHGKTAEPGDTSEAPECAGGHERTGDEGQPNRKRRRLSRGRRGGRRARVDDGRADDERRAGDVESTEDERMADEERRRALRLIYEVAGCRDARQLTEITARIRELRDSYGGDPAAAPEPGHTLPAEATLAELKAHALSLLSGVPVVGELSLGAAVSATRAVLNDEVSLLEPPLLLHGDAVLLLIMRARAGYEDPGAREVALAPAGKLYACGLRAEELRDGVTIEERMRRYYRDDHRDRPTLIGMRFSDVIPEKPYPDEDWFFGSHGWIDAENAWRPGRAELIARWRRVASLCEDWGAARPTTAWQYALLSEKASLELTLLSPDYAMTFERDILGDARWPTSTRLGHQAQSRLLMLGGYRGTVRRLGMLRLLSTLALWMPRLPLRMLGRLARARRVRKRFLPSLYGPVGEQRGLARLLRWLLCRRHSELDGSVCGKRVWRAADPPLAPDYTTPTPLSGHVPSRAFRLRFRRHEFEPGWAPASPAAPPKGRLAKMLGRLAAVVRRPTGSTGGAR